METEDFVVSVDADVVRAARGAAMLHGIDIEGVVGRMVTNILTEYAEKVRKSIPKLEPPLAEDDIPF